MSIDDELRAHLVRLGATPGELDHVFEKGLSSEERKRRMDASLDALVAKRLTGAGMNSAEVEAALQGGPAAERAVESMVARSMSTPETQAAVLEGALEDPTARARLLAGAPPKRASRLRAVGILVAGGIVAFGGVKAYRALTKGPCEAIADGARMSAILGQPVKTGFSTKSAYGCTTDLESTEPGKYGTLVRFEMADVSSFEEWRRDIASKKVYRSESVALGDAATLSVAPPAEPIDMDAEIKNVREQAARVTDFELPSDDMNLVVDVGDGRTRTFDKNLTRTINEAVGLKNLRERVLSAPPSDHRILVRANRVALKVTVNGTEGQARAMAKALSVGGALDPMKRAQFR